MCSCMHRLDRDIGHLGCQVSLMYGLGSFLASLKVTVKYYPGEM